MSVTIAGGVTKLPRGESNGLAQWERQLAENPDRPIAVVALIRADTIEQRLHDESDPQRVKTLVLGIEAFGLGDAEGKTVEGLLRDAFQARTGKLGLPFEEEDGE